MKQETDFIEPYVVCNNGVGGDMKWYAIDRCGASAGPYDSEEEALAKNATLPEYNMETMP